MLPAAIAVFFISHLIIISRALAFTGDDVYDDGIILQYSYASTVLAILLFLYNVIIIKTRSTNC